MMKLIIRHIEWFFVEKAPVYSSDRYRNVFTINMRRFLDTIFLQKFTTIIRIRIQIKSVMLNLLQHLPIKRFRNKFGMTIINNFLSFHPLILQKKIYSRNDNLFYWLIILTVLLASCSKNDDWGPQSDRQQIIDTGGLSARSVLVLNEGNFGWGQATLSLYNPENETIQNGVYESINNSSLGNVAQSIEILNDTGYIVINNSNKVEVITLKDFKKIRTISGFQAPRYMKIVGANKSYITDLFANAITVFNHRTGKKIKEIPAQGWTEEVVLFDNTALVVERNETTSRLLFIDITTDKINQAISLGKFASSLVLDRNNKVWVLCNGGVEEELAKLYRINPISFSIEKVFTFSDIEASPSKLVIDRARENLYFLNSDIFKINIDASNLPVQAFIKANSRVLYGLDIDSINGDIYTSDAKDYNQSGEVFRYDVNGQLLDQFKVGVIPNEFGFY